MWVAETDNSEASKHSCAGPSSRAPLVHAGQGEKDILLSDTELSSLVQLIGEDVEHELGVTVSIDVAVCIVIEEAGELIGIDQVAVVCKGNAVGAVHVEWLGLSRCAASGGWVTEVAESHETWEILNTLSVPEDLGGHAVALALVDAPPAGTSRDPAGILASMLEIV